MTDAETALPATGKEILKTTCPRDCYDACGIAVVKREGRVTRVLGDPDHAVARGALCGKCAVAYNGVWRDPAQRLTTPLKRSGPKGSGAFTPVSWEEALADIAARLNDIRSRGGHKILSAHYTGTCSVIARDFPLRFFNAINAAEVDPDTVCNAAGQVALDYVYGIAVKGFDPRTAKDTACFMVWGANPHASGPHAHKHYLQEQPGTLVVVDPIRTPTAEIADIHLQPRPGTDAALAFSLMHEMKRLGLVDRAFIDAHTVGYAHLEPLIDGCPAAWGEAQTGVPAAEITRVAEIYGRGPSMLWVGQGMQRQPQGGNIIRAIAMLPAVTGHIGKPGTGIYYLNGKGPTRHMKIGEIAGEHLRTEPEVKISHMDLVDGLNEPGRFESLIVWNMNIAASNPRQRALHEAMKRDDLFTVVVDLFQTASANLADYILPAASFLEFDDLVGSYMWISTGPQTKVMEPIGESLPNQEIFRRLARAMGLTQAELYEDDRSMIDRQLTLTGLGVTFEELKARGTIDQSPEVLIFHEDLKFPTPSGKIEIASEAAAAAGHGLTPQASADAPPADGWLRLINPASPWQMNSSYANDPRIRELHGPIAVTLNPADAARFGIATGQPVRVASETGALTMIARISDGVPAGVAYSPKNGWALGDEGNVNVLNPGIKTDMGESTAVHGTLVQVARATEQAA